MDQIRSPIKNVLAFFKQYASPVESTSLKINNFNIIRFIAAFMVIHGHMSVIMGQPKLLIVGSYVSTFGVRIFFVISGYLITKSYLSDNHFGRYMIRRTFRIFPALIVTTLLVAIASWYLVEKPMQKLAQKWIARIGKKKTAA